MRLVPGKGVREVVLAGVAALAAVVLAAWLAPRAARPPDEEGSLEALGDYGSVPEFELIERSGRRIGLGDLLGAVWVANFIYTECTETCPTQSLQIVRLAAEFREAPALRFVSITVDPAHDTPAVLREYAQRYRADPERWLFLTGDKRRIQCLAKEGFRLGVVDPEDPSAPACRTPAPGGVAAAAWRFVVPPAFATHGSKGLVMHSARLVLVHRDAHIRAYHQATDPESMERLSQNLRTLLRPAR